KRQHRRERDRRLADRIKIILAFNQGYSAAEIAAMLLIDEETPRRYLDAFLADGLKQLLSLKYKGSEPLLSDEQKSSLKIHLSEHTYLSSKEITLYIKNRYNLKISISSCRAILKNLGFVYRKPKVIPGKVNEKNQIEFVEKYEELKKNLSPEDKIYFIDGVHPTHNVKPAFGWILKSEKKTVRSNTGRQRININGALCLNKKEILFQESKTINAQSTINLFKTILSENQNAKNIYIICDNARYYKCELLSLWLKENPIIKMIYLPPYAPNLNLIERVWRHMHKKVTYNKYYAKVSIFRENILNFFLEFKNNWEEVGKLLNDKFQIIGNTA
ncbi:MAG: IS630 family transposase, partial [Bacteroidota bacterium]